MRSKVWLAILFGAMNLEAAVSQSPAQPPVRSEVQSQPQSQPMAAMEMPHSKPSGPVGPLKITFADKSAEWTPTTLSALPHTTITAYNEHAKADQTYSGVELIELLKPLGVADKPHGKEFRLYLVAEGSDGYQVVYSIGEVTPDVHIGKVLVADTQDGKPIADDGPLKLVAVGEKRPARWVRNLVAIRVLTAQ
ncbi:MAG: hypothetical protein WBQ94_10720 [Terracidiphilus sp.]